jgi:hypothetical protein
MHACKITSTINSNNNYYITFCFLNEHRDDKQSEIDINSIVNYIRLNYKINNVPFIAEYDNIEHEVIKTTATTATTISSTETITTTTTLITYKLLLKKLNDKLKLLPPNTVCEISVLFEKEIDSPTLCIVK